ncbi:unnamed protein product [Boreogadus saida]
MEGQVAAPHPKGLEAANLEGLETGEVLEVEANLEVLESVGLESVGLEAAGGSNLEGLEAVVASWWARRRRQLLIQIEGVTGDEDHCSGADDPPPPPPPTHLSGEASSWCRRSNRHLFEETKQLND